MPESVSVGWGSRWRTAMMGLSKSHVARLAKEVPVHVAGAGADTRLAKRTGAHLLEGGPIEAAAGLATK